MKIALIQMEVIEKNKPQNVQHGLDLLRGVCEGTNVAVLPEMWTTGYSIFCAGTSRLLFFSGSTSIGMLTIENFPLGNCQFQALLAVYLFSPLPTPDISISSCDFGRTRLTRQAVWPGLDRRA